MARAQINIMFLFGFMLALASSADAAPLACQLLSEEVFANAADSMGGLPTHVFKYGPVVQKLIREGKSHDIEKFMKAKVVINGPDILPLPKRPEVLAKIIESEPVLSFLSKFPELAAKEWDLSGIGSTAVGQRDWGDHVLTVGFEARGKVPGEYFYLRLRIDPNSKKIDFQASVPARMMDELVGQIQSIRGPRITGSRYGAEAPVITFGVSEMRLNTHASDRMVESILKLISSNP